MIKDKVDTLFECTHNNITSLGEYIIWIPEWHTVVQKEHTYFTYTSIYIYIRSWCIIALQLWGWRWTKKWREDVGRSKREGEKKVKRTNDGSDIFTQLNHTNRTIEVHTRTTSNVRSQTCQLEKTLWFFFTLCLNAKIWRQLPIDHRLHAISPIDHQSLSQHVVSMVPLDLCIAL